MSHDHVLESYKQFRIQRRRELEEKRQKGYYANGDAIVSGKTKKKTKEQNKAHAFEARKDQAELRKSTGNKYAITEEQKNRFKEQERQTHLEAEARRKALNK